jgi:hypothetical protein
MRHQVCSMEHPGLKLECQGIPCLHFSIPSSPISSSPPRLLSVGIVMACGDNREFYAEVTDPDRLQATGWYGKGAVLPQFGKVANASCSYAELGARLSAFMDDLAMSLKTDEIIELAFGYHLDWELVDLAIKDMSAASWAQTRRRVRPLNVYEFTGFGPGKIAADAYFKAQALAPILRHHALCDARALRLSYDAAVQESATPDQAITSSTSSTIRGIHPGARLQAIQPIRANGHSDQAQGWQADRCGHASHLAVAPFFDDQLDP